MSITKKDLDTKICDFYTEVEATNEQTFREFIKESYLEFYGGEITDKALDSMTNKEVNDLLEHLDSLWLK